MALVTVSANAYLDGGVARVAGDTYRINTGARLTIRTDSRIHANAPAASAGSLMPDATFFDGIGGEIYIDSSAVREIAYTAGAGNCPAIGTTISADLSQAGWLPQTWTWGGVAGIFGVVVLVRDGSDPATHEAAAALVDALGAAGFNASKGDWPANWGRFRGTLNGPQTPSPTEAAIRIVVGEKARKAP